MSGAATAALNPDVDRTVKAAHDRAAAGLAQEWVVLDDFEFDRWLRQALHTLDSAGRDRAQGDFAWSCFKAEQAAQFATKGLLRALGKPAFGHALTRLLVELSQAGVVVPRGVENAGRDLEREYIPTRYGDVYPSGSPFEFYDDARAAACIATARLVLDFTKDARDDARGAQAAAP